MTGATASSADAGQRSPELSLGKLARSVLRAVRPRQWVKNVLVLAAPATAGILFHRGPAERSALTFAIFSAAAASTYLLNDVVDAAADRLHPVKRLRPIAAGLLSPQIALVIAALFAILALGGAALLSLPLLAVIASYLVLSYAYNVALKRVAVIELAIVSSGFVLRASAGAAATHVAISPWFLIVTSASSLLIVAGKRAAELSVLGVNSAEHRVALEQYTPQFLLACRIVFSSVAITSYCLWVFERSSQLVIGTKLHNSVFFELSIVPLVIALLYLELAAEQGRGGEPEQLALHDRTLQVLGCCWIALVALGIYA